MTTLSVTPAPDGNGNYLVRLWVVDVTLTAAELRRLRAAIDAALGDAKACDVCERPHSGCGTGCDGWK